MRTWSYGLYYIISQNMLSCTPGDKSYDFVTAMCGNRKVSSLETVWVFILSPRVATRPDFLFNLQTQCWPWKISMGIKWDSKCGALGTQWVLKTVSSTYFVPIKMRTTALCDLDTFTKKEWCVPLQEPVFNPSMGAQENSSVTTSKSSSMVPLDEKAKELLKTQTAMEMLSFHKRHIVSNLWNSLFHGTWCVLTST